MQNPRIETTAARAIRSPADDDPVPLDTERERELRAMGAAARQRRNRTSDIAAIRAKLTSSAAGHVRAAAGQVRGKADQHIADSDYRSFRKAVDAAIVELDQEAKLAEHEHHAAVVAEPSVYGPDSPFSYYGDLASQAVARLAAPEPGLLGARSSDVDMSPSAVAARLDKHVVDVREAIRKGTPYGKKAEAVIAESFRCEDVVEHRRTVERELRVFGTGSGPGTTATAGSQAAAFVSPYFLMAQWAPYRSPIRTFADQCASFPMPPYGMEVYVPTFSTSDKASLQTEGSAVAETVPSTSFESAEVKNASGQLLLSQQWADRMNSAGGAFDELISQELGWRVDAEIGKYVLNQALVGATVVSGASSYSEAGFWKDLASAREQLADTAGTRLRATSMFTTTDFYGFVTRQVDATTNRPIWPPWYATAFPLAADTDSFKGPDWPKYARYMETVMPGGIVWMVDDAIPTYGTTAFTQIIVSAPAVAMVLCESPSVVSAWPETKAAELDVVLNCRRYCCAISRHAGGTATVQGAAYAQAEK